MPKLLSLQLSGTSISGSVPLQLGQLTALALLNLSYGRFARPVTSFDRRAYLAATLSCRTRSTMCTGIPPQSCTAFSDSEQLRPSFTDPAACVVCNGDPPWLPPLLALSALTLVGVALLA
eukprot:5168090-Prymnesium_polylepis.2